VAKVSEDLTAQGYRAGDVMKVVAQLAGGGGGGSASFARGGGRTAQLDEAFAGLQRHLEERAEKDAR
jgi:alanyl-tRNA synthetase